MYVFLPLLLLQLFFAGSILVFCLGSLASTYRALRAKRYDDAIAGAVPTLLLVGISVGAFLWINS